MKLQDQEDTFDGLDNALEVSRTAITSKKRKLPVTSVREVKSKEISTNNLKKDIVVPTKPAIIEQTKPEVIEKIDAPTGNSTLCRNYSESGICRFGEKCRYSHDTIPMKIDPAAAAVVGEKRIRKKTRSKQKNIRRDKRSDTEKPNFIHCGNYVGRPLTEVLLHKTNNLYIIFSSMFYIFLNICSACVGN